MNKKEEFLQRRLAAGVYSLLASKKEAAELFSLGYQCVSYWEQKILDDKHPNTHGGVRFLKFFTNWTDG